MGDPSQQPPDLMGHQGSVLAFKARHHFGGLVDDLDRLTIPRDPLFAISTHLPAPVSWANLRRS